MKDIYKLDVIWTISWDICAKDDDISMGELE